MLDSYPNIADLNISVNRPLQVESAGQLVPVPTQPMYLAPEGVASSTRPASASMAEYQVRFDTTTGPKREAESYRKIALAIGVAGAGSLGAGTGGSAALAGATPDLHRAYADFDLADPEHKVVGVVVQVTQRGRRSARL